MHMKFRDTAGHIIEVEFVSFMVAAAGGLARLRLCPRGCCWHCKSMPHYHDSDSLDLLAQTCFTCVITAAETEKVDGRSIRRSLTKTGRYVRQPTKDEKSQELMEEHGGQHNTAQMQQYPLSQQQQQQQQQQRMSTKEHATYPHTSFHQHGTGSSGCH